MADLRGDTSQIVLANKDLERKIAQEQQRNQRLRAELADTENEIQRINANVADLERKKLAQDVDLQQTKEQTDQTEAETNRRKQTIRQLERDN